MDYALNAQLLYLTINIILTKGNSKKNKTNRVTASLNSSNGLLEKFPESTAKIVSLRVDSHVVSFREPLHTETTVGEEWIIFLWRLLVIYSESAKKSPFIAKIFCGKLGSV